MRSANILAIVAMAIWAGFLWMGIEGLKAVVAQHALGYPVPGQFNFYVGTPFGMMTAVAGVTLLANAFGRFWRASELTSALALFALLPYLFMYGGGV